MTAKPKPPTKSWADMVSDDEDDVPTTAKAPANPPANPPTVATPPKPAAVEIPKQDIVQAPVQAAKPAEVPVAQAAQPVAAGPRTLVVKKEAGGQRTVKMKDNLDAVAKQLEDTTLEEAATFEMISKAIGGLVDNYDVDKIVVNRDDETCPYYSVKTFEEIGHLPNHLPIPEPVLSVLHDLHYEKPSKIQELALPLLLENTADGRPKNMIFQSQAGTGKTAAFALTILSRIDPSKKHVQAIVMTTTYDLCVQTATVIAEYAKKTKITIHKLHGVGKFVDKTKPQLDIRITDQIVVATHGALKTAVVKPPNKRPFDPSLVQVLVVDEADNLLEGVDALENLKTAVKAVKRDKCQIIFCSATFSPELKQLAEATVPSPRNSIHLPQKEVSVTHIKQFYILCNGEAEKFHILKGIYSSVKLGQTIIFVETKRTAQNLCEDLRADGFNVALLTGGDMTFEERDSILARYRKGKDRVLITTNVLSRGIDVPQISMVVNFDLPVKCLETGGDFLHNPRNPTDFDTYQHRIGRTGRFGKEGAAISLIDRNYGIELQRINEISKHWGRPIDNLATDQNSLEKHLEDS